MTEWGINIFLAVGASSCPAGRGRTRASGGPAALSASPGARGGRGNAGCHRAVREARRPLTVLGGRGRRWADGAGRPLETWTWCRRRPR